MIRTALAVLAGVLAGVLVVSAFMAVSVHLFPMPTEGVDLTKPDVAKLYMDRMALEAKLLVLAGWTAGLFIAGWVARWVAYGQAWAGWTASVTIFLAILWNFVSLPHPLWMIIAAMILSALAALAAQRLPVRPAPSGPAARPPL